MAHPLVCKDFIAKGKWPKNMAMYPYIFDVNEKRKEKKNTKGYNNGLKVYKYMEGRGGGFLGQGTWASRKRKTMLPMGCLLKELLGEIFGKHLIRTTLKIGTNCSLKA